MEMQQQEKVKKNKLTEFQKSHRIIRSLVLKDKGFQEKQLKTGYSYFKGNTRLVKLVSSKESVILEINTELSNELKELPGMKFFTHQQAHSKHLGTMRYLYEAPDSENIEKIILNAVKNFVISDQEQQKKEIQAEKQVAVSEA